MTPAVADHELIALVRALADTLPPQLRSIAAERWAAYRVEDGDALDAATAAAVRALLHADYRVSGYD